MKHILMYSSNSCFEFCILQLKKKSLKKKTQVFVLRVCFQFVHSSENFLHGLWSFSLKCARRLSQTQTPLRTFYRNSALLWNLLALWMMPLRNGTVSLLSERSEAIPRQQEEARESLATSGCKRRQVREHLNLSWNVWNKDAGPLPV